MDLVPELFRVQKKKKNDKNVRGRNTLVNLIYYVPDHITIKISFRTTRPYKVKYCTTDTICINIYIYILTQSDNLLDQTKCKVDFAASLRPGG